MGMRAVHRAYLLEVNPICYFYVYTYYFSIHLLLLQGYKYEYFIIDIVYYLTEGGRNLLHYRVFEWLLDCDDG